MLEIRVLVATSGIRAGGEAHSFPKTNTKTRSVNSHLQAETQNHHPGADPQVHPSIPLYALLKNKGKLLDFLEFFQHNDKK